MTPTYIIFGLIALITFAIGFALGFVSTRSRISGTLVLNIHSKDKPFFELHFTEDPKKFESGEIVSFKLDMR